MALPRFEKHPVVKATVRITKAGDGLSEALKFQPEALDLGTEVYFVLKGVVEQVNHRPFAKDDDRELVRVHTIAATEITRVDGDEVEPFLKAADERLAEFRLAESLAAEKAAGIERLPGQEGDTATP